MTESNFEENEIRNNEIENDETEGPLIIVKEDFESEAEFLKVLEGAVEELDNREEEFKKSGSRNFEMVIIRINDLSNLGKEMSIDDANYFLEIFKDLSENGPHYNIFCQVKTQRPNY